MQTRQSVLQAFEAYLLTQKCVSPNTASAYMQDMEQFAKIVASYNKTFSEVTHDDLHRFLAVLKEQQVSARSICRKLSTLKSFFGWAHTAFGWKNPTLTQVSPKVGKKLPNYLSEGEVQALFAVVNQDQSKFATRNRVIVYLLYVAGLRISELGQLQTSQIQKERKCLLVRGKGNKERLIPLPDIMMVLLEKYLTNDIALFIHKYGKTEFIFPVFYAGTIKHLTRQALWVIIKSIWRKTAIHRSISPHSLRHSLATHLLQHGADLRSLQLLLGHEQITTVQIYTHVETSHLRTLYDKYHPRA